MSYSRAAGIGLALGGVEWILASSSVPWFYSVLTVCTGALIGYFVRRAPLRTALLSGAVASVLFDALFLLMIRGQQIEFSHHRSASSFFLVANLSNVLVVFVAAVVVSTLRRGPPEVAA